MTAIWSALHHTVPLLIVVANKHIGQAIEQSDVDTVEGFTAALGDALSLLREGCIVVIDARIAKGYAATMSKGITER